MVKSIVIQISDHIDRWCRTGAIVFFSAMVVLVMFQVLARYIFRAVPVWTEEAARYCMVWGGLLGATVAFKGDSDPKLLSAPKSGPKVWLRTATVLRAAAVLCFLGPIFYHSRRFLMRHWDRTAEALGISTFWVTMAVPFAVSVIFIHLLARSINSGGPEPPPTSQPD